MAAFLKEAYLKRQQAFSRLVKKGGGAMMVSSLVNVRYLTGFKCTYGRLLAAGGKKYLLTDSRYTADARKNAAGVQVVETTADRCNALILNILKSHGADSLAFEKDAVTHAEFLELKTALKGIRLAPVSSVVEALRLLKDEHEIAALRRACRAGDRAFDFILGKIRPGRTEKAVAADLDMFMIGLQAEGLAFESIVAAGPRGAFPHAKPSDEKIRKGDLVVLDFGICIDGYNSDMTRTVAVGVLSDDKEKMYSAVKAAQQAALESARAGVVAATVDETARRALGEYGLDKYFTHGLGHGVGIEVHEQPRVSFISDARLRKGMVFTVEPGVYVESVGGVRIEDTVFLGADGLEILTRSSKKLIVL